MQKKQSTKEDVYLPQRNFPYDYPTDELKEFLGDFENKYNNCLSGERVSNHVLGRTSQKIVQLAEQMEAIKKITDPYPTYRVVLPGYEIWEQKVKVMKELKRRRNVAEGIENESFAQIDRNKIASLFSAGRQASQNDLQEAYEPKLIQDTTPSKNDACITCGELECDCEVKTISDIPF